MCASESFLSRVKEVSTGEKAWEEVFMCSCSLPIATMSGRGKMTLVKTLMHVWDSELVFHDTLRHSNGILTSEISSENESADLVMFVLCVEAQIKILGAGGGGQRVGVPTLLLRVSRGEIICGSGSLGAPQVGLTITKTAAHRMILSFLGTQTMQLHIKCPCDCDDEQLSAFDFTPRA